MHDSISVRQQRFDLEQQYETTFNGLNFNACLVYYL